MLLPHPDRDLVVAACLASLQAAATHGVSKALLGVSSAAILLLTHGHPMCRPILTFRGELDCGEGGCIPVEVPVFCDPGLPGIQVYAIAWPPESEDATLYVPGEVQG